MFYVDDLVIADSSAEEALLVYPSVTDTFQVVGLVRARTLSPLVIPAVLVSPPPSPVVSTSS